MAKRKSTKGQTTTYKTHIKLDQVTRTSQKIGVNSGALEGFAVPAPLVAPSWMSKEPGSRDGGRLGGASQVE